MKNTLVGTLAVANIALFTALFTKVALAQSTAISHQGRLEEVRVSSKGTPTNVAAASSAKLLVSKTAHVSGQDVCGVIRMTNIGWSPAIIVGIADSLEVHFYSNIPPSPLPVGSSPNWFRVATIPIQSPGTIAPFATASINYCFSLCQAADHPGANSMRNAISVSVANPPGNPRTVVALSNSFPPPVLDCQACCLANGSCVDAVPARCNIAGGLPRGTGTDCASTECTQACCLPSGSCQNKTLSACEADDGEALGLGTDCATTTITCRGACCIPLGCIDGLTAGDCEFYAPGPGTYLGNDTACESEFDACPTGACCSDGTCIETYPLGGDELHLDQSGCEGALVGGHYLGDGETCTPTSCNEACCFGNSCEELLPSDCEGQGGDPQGQGTGCPNIGPTPCDVSSP